ncbi:MAG: PAS domain S-box-containing protein [Cyclobacteriaceae bacterium]|jgi:PAS domain S-box-containing protein
MSTKPSVLHIIFPIIIIALTIMIIALGRWIWVDARHDRIDDLSNTASLLDRYYDLTFKQRQLSLLSVGQRLSEISGEDHKKQRQKIADNALKLYDDLSAIGFADTTGQLMTLTGYDINDELPNLGQMIETRRTFEEAKRSDRMIIGEVYYFDRVNDWILPIRVPIKNEANELIAVNTSGVVYSILINNLKSFGFPDNYHIQMVNNRYHTTQLYYPLARDRFPEVLRQSADIYQVDYSQVWTDKTTLFEGINSLTDQPTLGVKSAPGPLEHYVVVTVDSSIVISDFWNQFQTSLGIYVIFLAITLMAYSYSVRQEKTFAEELEAEKSYSERIIRTTPLLIIGLDKNLRCTFVNPTAETLLQYPKEELIGKEIYSVLGTDIAQKFAHGELSPYFQIKKELSTIYTKKGAEKIALWDSVNMLDLSGEIEEIFLFGSDQTEKEAALLIAKVREANLNALIESTNSIIGLFDKNKQLIEYNKAFEAYTIETTDIDLATSPDIVEKMGSPYTELFNGFLDRALTGEKLKETIEFEGKGNKFFFLFNYNPIYQDDQITGVSMFVEDITGLKESEKKLEKYSKDLEGLVSERTQELKETHDQLKDSYEALENTLAALKETQEQLIQTEKMASLGVLSAGIGHEVNNPLNFIKNGVIGLSNLLKEQQLSDKETIEQFLAIIHEGVNRASAIVKSLSHFSRKGESLVDDCNLEEAIENSLTILQSKLKHKVTVSKSYNHKGVTIKGSSGKLHQAILNILSNAEQAIEEKGHIKIITGTSKDTIWISIADDGCGIQPQLLNRISDPFYTTKDPGEGTGLGLSIAYAIIEEHSGRIKVNSKVNEGSTFILEFPTSSKT